jgi:CheY-like chemotaxis protein
MNSLRPILLVEDNLEDIELTVAALKRNNVANEVVTARHGGEGLDYLYQRGKFKDRLPGLPVVVFLDLKMPKVDGLEVLRTVKNDPVMKTLPIVMLTSSREEADLVKSYQLGVNAYVVKPVGFEQFTDAIRQLGIFWAVLNEPPPG